MRVVAGVFLAIAATGFVQSHSHGHSPDHVCGHDADVAVQRQLLKLEGREGDELVPRGFLNPDVHPPHPTGARALQEQQWRPLRIHVEYKDLSALTAAQQTYLKDEIVQPMVDYAGRMLRVRQRQNDDRLFIGRECSNYLYLGDEQRCKSLRSTAGRCGGETIPEKYYGTVSTWERTDGQWIETVHQGGDGVPGDFLLIVRAQAGSPCGLGALAYASSCTRDDIDRPIAGRYNHCPDAIDTSPEKKHETQITALHEMMHALMFAEDNFKWFRNPDTLDPIFPVDETTGKHPTITTEGCGISKQVKFPSSMIEFSGERGQPSCPDIETAASIGPYKCTQRMVLPKVKDEARKWFACNEINGPELENQDGSCQLAGSHWDQRSMHADLMTPRVSASGMVTPMTLALFEDSGWFQANYDAIGTFNPGREWGHLAGCDLFDKRGIYGADPAEPFSNLQIVKTAAPLRNQEEFFCLRGGTTNYCSMDLRATGQCQVSDFNTRDVDPIYQYFSNPKKYGRTHEMDFLPHISHNFMCEWESSYDSQDFVWNAVGAYFGQDHETACFPTSLQHSGQSARSSAACYRYECDLTDPDSPVLTVKPLTSDRSGVQGDVTCSKGDGGVLKSVSGMSGSITCHEPEVLCGSTADPSPTPTPSASPSPTPAGGSGGGGKGDASPSPAAQSGGDSGGGAGSDASPSPTQSPSPAPIALSTDELAEDYCPGTTDAHTSGDYPSVAGARVSLAGVSGDLSCDAAPDLQAACASVLDVEASRVAVKVPGASGGRRLQGAGGSQQEVTVAVAAESSEEAATLATTLTTSVSSGTLATALAQENQQVFGSVSATVAQGSDATFSGSLPAPENDGGGNDGDGVSNRGVIALAILGSLLVVGVVAVGLWHYMRTPTSRATNVSKAGGGKGDTESAKDVDTAVPANKTAPA